MAEATDVLVVGGGVMGLWGALRAAEAGLSVTLVDAGGIGQGASGGLLGALFPWMPDRWCEKKQYQLDALVSLPDEIARLEALTGLSANFRRVGRIIPLPKPHLRAIALRHGRDAEANWRAGGQRFHWHLHDGAPAGMALDAEACGAGHVLDTLAARVEPRALGRLLRAALERQPKVRLVEHAALVALDPIRGRATLAGSPDRIAFSHALVAAGAASFGLLETLLPPLPKPLGQGVKGQAALLAARLDPQSPVVFLDGLYVVPHQGGLAAVGSTSETGYADPTATDGLLDDVVARARRLMPALAAAPVVERWAGIRPKAVGRDPLVGPLPDHANVVALTGGFKISFGLAHRLALSALDAVLGGARAPLPDNFTLAGQLSAGMAASGAPLDKSEAPL
jgi:glycine/D-amino acid oxidase-like deaminating enzyme